MPAEPELHSSITQLDTRREEVVTRRNKIMPGVILGSIGFVILMGIVFQSIPALFISAILAFIFSVAAFQINVSGPFKEIKSQFKSAMIEEFMQSYHPDINYRYQMEKSQARSLIKASGLISPDEYHEEDVIQGTYNKTSFYISEVDLKNKSKNSSYTIFKGILFRIKLPGKRFPKSRIQSKPGLLKRLWSNFKREETYGFDYESKDEKRFKSEMSPLFPFIKHLAERQGDIRMFMDKDEIILLMESKMKLLDDPPPKLTKSLNMEHYNERMGRQLNSLLYIVEAMSNELSSTEIEERLELKAEELVKSVRELKKR